MKKITEEILQSRIRQALGTEPADLVIRNVAVFPLTTGDTAVGNIAVCGDTIVGVGDHYSGKQEVDGTGLTAVPGFIDSHVHVESSMVIPPEFERCLLTHGVTTAVCDPHELANVAGTQAFEYFFQCARAMCMDLRVQISSCVPSTPFETSGASISPEETVPYAGCDGSLGLAELMNVPGVLNCEEGMLRKIAPFCGRIDGHAPLLGGRELNAYLSVGVRNCHESSFLEEAQEKLQKGMQVFIREGSVGRNLEGLMPLLTAENAPFLAFCTDDRNPLDIEEEGHIDYMIARAIELGADPLTVYRTASLFPARHFGLRDRGVIAPGYLADIVLLSDFRRCRVKTVIKGGRLVNEALFAERCLPEVPEKFLHTVKLQKVAPEVFRIREDGTEYDVIGIREKQLLTDALRLKLPVKDHLVQADPEQDAVKIAVLERHGKNGDVGLGFVKGFGLRQGAIASSVGHDSHNICVAGVDDRDMAAAVNALIDTQGGFSVAAGGEVQGVLPLPVGGLMSREPYEKLAGELRTLQNLAGKIGCSVDNPFLKLSFMALPVIPFLRITDKGMIHVK